MADAQQKEYGRINASNLQSETEKATEDYNCSKCSRSFPNLIRYHAHMQMHKDDLAKKQRSNINRPFPDEKIFQLD